MRNYAAWFNSEHVHYEKFGKKKKKVTEALCSELNKNRISSLSRKGIEKSKVLDIMKKKK
ncbi:CLUMA_CG016942, isoform A [Clunio marinus]|uniref:CLUMA_CG016942, isoform A n=1 Tax=Clunio marinus TaxID=568069 RepID=A0A1J1ISK6_9DIPT|nr:CLUMA_CG016942, isoform A [Clunio marinus]